MTRTRSVLVAIAASVLFSGSRADAQAPPTPVAPPAQSAAAPAKAAAPEPPPVPLKVQVTLMRLEKDVVVTRLPFTLWVNANDQETVLNMGSNVPVPQNAVTSNGQPASFTSIAYQPVATNIHCSAKTTGDGRYRVNLYVNDSSVSAGKDGMPPIMHSLQATNILLLRDGQLAEFASATDKATGEVTRIDVVVTALK